MACHACSRGLHVRQHVSRSGKFFFLAHYAEEVYLTPNSRDVSSLQWYVQRQCDSYTISYYSQWSGALDPHHWILVETRAEIAAMQS